MTWRPDVLFEICCDGGDDVVPWRWLPVRGWVRDPWGITCDGRRRYTLHHIPTGAQVPAGRIETLEAAQDLAAKLDELAVDWSLDTHEALFGQLRRTPHVLDRYHELVPPMRAVV